MKIEVGKFYRTKCGYKAFVLQSLNSLFIKLNIDDSLDYKEDADIYLIYIRKPESNDRFTMFESRCREDGKNINWIGFPFDMSDPKYDLIEEWVDEQQKPMINGVEVKVGQWWETRDSLARFKITGLRKANELQYIRSGNDQFPRWFENGLYTRGEIHDWDLVKLVEDVE